MSYQLDLKIATKLLGLKQSAEIRKKEFNLTFLAIKNIYRSKKCYYTGIVLTGKNRSIDRIDNSKGYVIGNVVACDKDFNIKKGDLSLQDIEILYKKVIKQQRK